GQKSYTGIYTDDVYELTIGNNAQSANVFDNLVCGIQSYNSYITINKNIFKNIKKARCAITNPTDFVGLYCETAIHVAKKPGSLTYTPVVRVTGTDNTNHNTFINCDKAYYSYKALSTITYNGLSTTTIGFFCRDAINGSMFTNNTITGAKQGIYVLNSLPEYKNITIQSNTITSVPNAGFGIGITNCKSDATHLVYIQNNNNINITNNVACTGIIATACDNIAITNNPNINCSSLNTSTYRTSNRGINISDCPNSMVKGNTLSKFGTGIWAE
ncbi:MAG: hypothetical protein WCJ61_16965, partial [Paludibacter sp.]